MTRRIVIIGCGGLGREVFSILRALENRGEGWSIEGFVDDGPAEENVVLVKELGSTVLGPLKLLTDGNPTHAVIAVGSNSARAAILETLAGAPISWATLAHPATTLGLQVTVGVGSVIGAGARLSTNIRLGQHVQIDQNCAVGHDCLLDDFARLSPQSCLSGSVHVGEGALIGANATVLPGLRVGRGAVVGAGAVVVRDVPDGVTVKGIPAR